MYSSADFQSPLSRPVPGPQLLDNNHPLKAMYRRMCSARETQAYISRRLKCDLYALAYLLPSIASPHSHINHIEHDKCLSNRRYKLRRALARSTRAELTIISRKANLESKIQLQESWLFTSDNNTRKKLIMSAYNPDDDPCMDEAAATEAWSPYHDSGQPIWLLNPDLPGTPGYVPISHGLVERGVLWGAPTAHNAFIRPTTFYIPSPKIAERDALVWTESLGLVRADGYLHWMSKFKDGHDGLELAEEQTRTIIVHDRDEHEGHDDREGKGRRGETEYTGSGLMETRCLSGPWYSGFGYDASPRRIRRC